MLEPEQQIVKDVGLMKEIHARYLDSAISCMKYFERANTYLEKQTAESFTPFRYIRLNETMSSKILADLLNPKGTHGQGTLFLDAFLKRFTLENFSKCPEKAEVRTEARTYAIEASMRSMDICITFPDAILAIENKLWAENQPNQVQDYLQHIQFIKKQFHLIYLSPSTQSIHHDSLSSEAAEKFSEHYSLILWEDVLDLLEECTLGACPEKLRVFIKDFNRAVRTALW